MTAATKLRGRTAFISGASRGIGRAIARRLAEDGMRVVVAAKSSRPHRILPGTIHSVVEEIEAAGGEALACQMDVRKDDQVQAAVQLAADHFGGIDVLVNNASAIQLTKTEDTALRRFDLMHQVNVRGTFACSQAAIPWLRKSSHAHILNLAPPLAMDSRWFGPHTAYTISKYGMSMCVLGMSQELREDRIAVNGIWPATTIATAAIENVVGDEDMMRRSRTPTIVADAVALVLEKDPAQCTGNLFLDEEVLHAAGVADLSGYAVDPTAALQRDLFVGDPWSV